MKIGDKVRFLSEVGGGTVTGFQGKNIVLVEDADGFDIPMPINECVVIETDDYNIPTPAAKLPPRSEEKRSGKHLLNLPQQEHLPQPLQMFPNPDRAVWRNRRYPSIASLR